jgi:hypothetical protein
VVVLTAAATATAAACVSIVMVASTRTLARVTLSETCSADGKRDCSAAAKLVALKEVMSPATKKVA